MRKWVIVVVVVLVLVLFLPVSNLIGLGGRNVPIAVKGGAPRFQSVSLVLQEKCVDCHSSALTRMPIYAKLPIASAMIRKDIEEGEEHFKVTREQYSGEQPFTAIALARLENAVEEGSMPPGKYVMMHWNSRLAAGEKESILAWIREERARRDEAREMSDALKGEPIQPLPLTVAVNADKAALGERLYHDTRLSGDNTISCATCHALHLGGTDQEKVSTGIRGQKGPINSPTVYNSAYNLAQFWDGRARDLQEQAAGPVENPVEMGAKFDEVAEVLGKDGAYASTFAALYADGITKDNITGAIAAFEETLVTPNSRFDKWLRGDPSAITAEEKEGYALFKSEGCTSCHVGPALGGGSFEKMGEEEDYFAARGGEITKADLGRFNVTGKDEDRHRFKVPILRNVAVTFPYFHDGSSNDLGEAIGIMARFQQEEDLTPDQVGKIKAFLLALTGEYRGTPVDRIPRPATQIPQTPQAALQR